MLIRVPEEKLWVPYVVGSGRLVGVRTWHGLAPMRVFAHADAEVVVVLRVSRRAARTAYRRVEGDEPVRLTYRDFSVDLQPESPTEYAVSFNGGLVRRHIYRANVLNVLRPLT